MITIHRKSRLHKFVQSWCWRGSWSLNNEVKTLCQYFWATVGALFKFALTVVFYLFITLAGVGFFTALGFAIVDDFLSIPVDTWWKWVLLPIISAPCLAAGVGVFFCVMWCGHQFLLWLFYGKWRKKSKDKKGPKTLLGQYLKAKKEKICPLVRLE